METNKSCLPLFIVQPVIWPITHYSACNFSINTAQLAEPAEHQRMWMQVNTPSTHTRRTTEAQENYGPPKKMNIEVSLSFAPFILSHTCKHAFTRACKRVVAMYEHMYHFWRNLNAVIASSAVIKWSYYVLKHEQCRVLIDSEDLTCKSCGCSAPEVRHTWINCTPQQHILLEIWFDMSSCVQQRQRSTS